MKGKNRILLCVCAAVLLLAGTVTGVYARYIRYSSGVENKFDSAVSITPEFSNGASNVSIAVGGKTDYPVYVRAEIIVTWQDANGTVYFSKPSADRDYSLVLNLSATGWVEGDGDGYYYYKPRVESEGSTDILIKSWAQRAGANPPAANYALNVEVIAQTVQAVGYTDGDGVDPTTEIEAYKDAWGLS